MRKLGTSYGQTDAVGELLNAVFDETKELPTGLSARKANEGIPIHVIQHALGHANASITSLYISHLSPTVVIDTLKSREWKVSA